MKQLLFVAGLVVAACSGSSKSGGAGGTTTAQAQSKVLVNVDDKGIALGGYDPYGYAKHDKPVSGLPEYSATYNGATFLFASVDNRDAFVGAQHAPQYGGFCAYAASQGNLSPADPHVFQLQDNQLLVFTNDEFKELFNQDIAGNKAKADAAWPGLVAKHGK